MFTSFPQSTGKGVNERGIVGGKGCASNFTFVGLENKSCSLCGSVSECEREREIIGARWKEVGAWEREQVRVRVRTASVLHTVLGCWCC